MLCSKSGASACHVRTSEIANNNKTYSELIQYSYTQYISGILDEPIDALCVHACNVTI